MNTLIGFATPQTFENGRIPPLCNGDRLTAAEYERRYDAMPELKKAELINGVVYFSTSVSFLDHAGPHSDLIGSLGFYCMMTSGIRGGDNATVRLPGANRPQPDVCLIILPSHGGQVRIENCNITGAPELVAEVAAGSESYDLHDKLEVYRDNGVKEYVVWRVFEKAIDWFINRAGRFEPLTLGSDAIYRSEVFPGLWLDPGALMAGNMARVLQVVQMGVATPAHADFVTQLNRNAAKLKTER